MVRGRGSMQFTLLRDEIPKAKASIGYENEHTLNLLTVYAKTLYMDKGNISELMEASMVLEDAEKVARRVLGPAHPLTVEMGNDMKRVGERMDELAALAIAHSKNPSSSAGRAVKTFSLDQLSGLIDKLAVDSPALKK